MSMTRRMFVRSGVAFAASTSMTGLHAQTSSARTVRPSTMENG